jgi:hypothetical protein
MSERTDCAAPSLPPDLLKQLGSKCLAQINLNHWNRL